MLSFIIIITLLLLTGCSNNPAAQQTEDPKQDTTVTTTTGEAKAKPEEAQSQQEAKTEATTEPGAQKEAETEKTTPENNDGKKQEEPTPTAKNDTKEPTNNQPAAKDDTDKKDPVPESEGEVNPENPQNQTMPDNYRIVEYDVDAEPRGAIIHNLARMICQNSSIVNAATDIGETNNGIIIMLKNPEDYMFDIYASRDGAIVYCDLLCGYGMGGDPIDSTTVSGTDLAVMVQWIANHL